MRISIKDRILEKDFQRKILLELANGYSYKEIKQKLKITDYEMRYCIKFLYNNYNAVNKISLVCRAICAKDIDITKIKIWKI